MSSWVTAPAPPVTAAGTAIAGDAAALALAAGPASVRNVSRSGGLSIRAASQRMSEAVSVVSLTPRRTMMAAIGPSSCISRCWMCVS